MFSFARTVTYSLVSEAGHPDEDELFESAIVDTNMVYEIADDELIPFDKYWGAIPKIEMLKPNKVCLFIILKLYAF